MRSPRNNIDRRSVEREFKDLGPGASVGCCAGGLLAPDQHLAIVGRGRQDCAEFRMRLEIGDILLAFMYWDPNR